MGFDWYYLVLVVPAMLLALWAQFKVNSTFRRYAQVPSLRQLTGAQAAETVLRQNGVTGVRIERVSGNLTDHYDPRQNVIRLSDGVYGSTSCAAIGVAAHEAGHAVQYAQEYTPIKVRQAIIPVTRIGSMMSWPLLIIGLVLSSGILIDIGLLLFSAVTLFQLVTLPVEFNASSRALKALEEGHLLTDEELVGAKRTLSAAAMTYVAALAVSLAQLLRLILISRSRNRD